MIKVSSRIIFVMVCLFSMTLSVYLLYARESITVSDGIADLRTFDFHQNGEVALSGDWEFYWDQLLTSENINSTQPTEKIFIKVPGAWSMDERVIVPNQGVASYRVIIQYPKNLTDPAIRIQNVATAYKVYANGQLIGEAGSITRQDSDFIDQEKLSIIELPSESGSVEVII